MNYLSKINLPELEGRFHAFQNMDLETTWVDFEKMTLTSSHVEVLVPVLHPKPSRITRLFYWFLSFVGIVIYDYGKTAQKLKQSVTHFKNLTDDSDHRAIIDTSKKILVKIAKNHFFDWKQIQLEPFTELAVDWSNDGVLFPMNERKESLYDESFVEEILAQSSDHFIVKAISDSFDRQHFLSFLNRIMEKTSDEFLFTPRLSYPENAKRFRHMVLAILNLIHSSNDVHGIANDIMPKITEAISISKNFDAKNRRIEEIFYNIFSRNCSDLRFNVVYFLQIIRRDLLKDAIDDLMTKLPGHWIKESTFGYYFRTMHQEFGISDSSTDNDTSHERGAAKGKEEELRSYFYDQYTSETIVNQILVAINDRDDSRISTKLFERWALDYYGKKSNQWIDKNGQYQINAVVTMLRSFGILT